MEEILKAEAGSVPTVVRKMIGAAKMEHQEVAAKLGMSRQSLSNRVVHDTFSANDLLKIAEATGFTVKVEQAALTTPRAVFKGVGRRCKRMVTKIIFDTELSDAICHTDENDGCFMELYRDREGRFFVVHYTDWKDSQDFITTISPEDAKALYAKYGDGLMQDMVN